MFDTYALEQQRDSEYRRKASYERQIVEIDAKLERLRDCKNAVKTIKNNIGDLKRKANRRHYDFGDWKGSKYDAASDLIESTLHSDYQKYEDDTDQVLDSICDEITRLENQRRDTEGLLGSVINAINSLTNEIEKLFN